jgi:hypothetical protein
MKETHTDVEGIVEEFNKLHLASIILQSGMMMGNNTEEECMKSYERIEDWLRITLQSQADQYEREKGEIFVEGYVEGLGACGLGIPEEEKERIAQKYGVDLSE